MTIYSTMYWIDSKNIKIYSVCLNCRKTPETNFSVKKIIVLGFRASRLGKHDVGSVIKLLVDRPIERGPRSCRFLWLAERAGVTHGARRLFVCFSSARLAGNRRSASYTCSRRSFSRRAGCNYYARLRIRSRPKFVYSIYVAILPPSSLSRYASATKQSHEACRRTDRVMCI